MQLTFPTGTPLATTNAAIADLTQQIAQIPDVDKQTGTAGSYQAGFGGSVTQGSVGQIHVFLKDNRKHSTNYWATALTQLARKKYARGNPVAIPATGTGGGNAQPIDYNITSDNDDPNPYAAKILSVLESTPGIVHAVSNASILAPQVDVVFDRERARALDVDIASAANGIRAAFGGATAAQFFTDLGVKYVQVTYPQSAQSSVDEINRIPVRTKTGQVTYAGDVSRLVQDPNTPLITRTNRQTVVHVSANTTPGIALSNVQRSFLQRVAALHLPNTVHVIPNARGQQQNLAETVSGMGFALILSFTLVYLLMVALYDSYVLPIIIMFAIPVASVGALGSLAIANQTLNLFSLIGTVMLIGLVSKNGILLVDFANHRIRAGIDRYTAIRESAQERFRPIIMTTASMIAGMLPIAVALEPGSEVRRVARHRRDRRTRRARCCSRSCWSRSHSYGSLHAISSRKSRRRTSSRRRAPRSRRVGPNAAYASLRSASDARNGLRAFDLAGRRHCKRRSGEATIPELRRTDDPSADHVSGCLDQRAARCNRPSARRSDRGCAQPRHDRDVDRVRTSDDRRALHALLGREHRSRPSAGPRAKRATSAAERSANAPSLDLRSE